MQPLRCAGILEVPPSLFFGLNYMSDPTPAVLVLYPAVHKQNPRWLPRSRRFGPRSQRFSQTLTFFPGLTLPQLCNPPPSTPSSPPSPLPPPHTLCLSRATSSPCRKATHRLPCSAEFPAALAVPGTRWLCSCPASSPAAPPFQPLQSCPRLSPAPSSPRQTLCPGDSPSPLPWEFHLFFQSPHPCSRVFSQLRCSAASRILFPRPKSFPPLTHRAGAASTTPCLHFWGLHVILSPSLQTADPFPFLPAPLSFSSIKAL